MANQKIRDELRRRGIRFWQLADAWGCSEPTVYRRLRHELPPETYILYKVNADRDDNASVDYVESAQTLIELSGMTNAQRGKAWQEKNSTTNAAKNPFTGALADAGVSPRTAVKVLDKYRTLDNADGKAKDKTAEFQQYLHELGFDAAQMAAARDTFSFYTSVPAKWK